MQKDCLQMITRLRSAVYNNEPVTRYCVLDVAGDRQRLQRTHTGVYPGQQV